MKQHTVYSNIKRQVLTMLDDEDDGDENSRRANADATATAVFGMLARGWNTFV